MHGIIATDELAEMLSSPALRLLDCRGSFAVYEAGHIPGAQFLHIETLRMTEGGVPCKMHHLPVLSSIFGQLGIDAETPVVAYTNDPRDQLSATYTAWTLAVTGHLAARVLDGGLAAWQREGRRIARPYPSVTEADYPPGFMQAYFADRQYVRDRLDDPDVVLVDSRTRPAYAGAAGSTMRRGHIPGAILHNYLWDFTPQGHYRTPEQLHAKYVRDGIIPEKEVITYCETGREGSSVWYVLKYLLGYPNVRLYQASLTEWAAFDALPMVMGDLPWGEMRQAA
jgi:thiosulfate/3-mercaptopyruvate sulfurtransferase